MCIPYMRQRFSLIEQASHECFVVFIRFNDSFPRTDAMRPMLKVNTMNLKCSKSVLLGTSALVCLALSAPVMADDFVITGSDNSTNGTGTTNGGTAAAIADTAINGSDTVSLGIALTTTGTNVGIKTNNNGTEAQSNTVTVTKTGSITTGTGNNAYGIFNDGAYNTTIVAGSIATGTGIYLSLIHI